MKRRLPISLAVCLGLGVLLSGGVLAQEGAQRCGPLPEPVAEKRDAILAATGGGLEEFAALADPAEFTSNYGGEDTLAYWQYLEGQGEDIRKTAKALLKLDCTVASSGGKVLYTWPAAVDLPFAELTEKEREAIGALHGGTIDSVYIEGTEFGYYAGWQLIITADGNWFALVAGD